MFAVAFGVSTMSRTQVQLWYNRFKEGREEFNGDARPGSPSMSTTDENIEIIACLLERLLMMLACLAICTDV